ncbi:hypothetical protein CIHG_02203 [Coccidioides immitis H538.4]|uniref:Uncharacterized protein n=1 Tax=Coccidioides immitis H538.4 TaxID=396776 RepID=A0A0J8UBD0_COCIT|nr:hypothetical protein CIHG_02203 [Coccidioides immitis H538.4]
MNWRQSPAKLAGWQQILAGKQRRGPSAIRPWSLRRTGVAFAACFSNQRPADGVMSGWRLMGSDDVCCQVPPPRFVLTDEPTDPEHSRGRGGAGLAEAQRERERERENFQWNFQRSICQIGFGPKLGLGSDRATLLRCRSLPLDGGKDSAILLSDCATLTAGGISLGSRQAAEHSFVVVVVVKVLSGPR